ncbi:unnamed protein product, partial [Effrenium voratum]
GLITDTSACTRIAMIYRRSRTSRCLCALLLAVIPCTFHQVLFTGPRKSDSLQGSRHRLARAAEEQVPELPPFQRFPEDYEPDPLDRVIEWFMGLDPQTNQILEGIFTLVVLGVTVLSAKETYEKWQKEKEQEDELKRQKIRRALNPDGWREELFREDQEEKRLRELEKKNEKKSKVADVLEEIYGTDGLEDKFNAQSAGRRRPAGGVKKS